jgi:hypothetical protein
LGNEHHDPHSIEEYKGFKYGQKIKLDEKEYSIYRIDDLKNEITLISKHSGFGYIDIDRLIELLKK